MSNHRNKLNSQTIPKARKPEKMTERDLAALCVREYDDSQILTTEIQEERKRSLDYFNQEPFGNEEDGLSAYVSSDVRDAIEWMLPQIVDIFVGGDTPIIFEPENEQDVEDADIESRYCQYVFERQNKGVILSVGWFKDALMQKNGIVKAWRQKTVKREREEYQGKSNAEWQALSHDDEFEISECTVTVSDVEYTQEEYAQIIASLPNFGAQIDAEAHYNIVGYRKKTVSESKIENVPPENFFIQKNHSSIFIKDARYCGEFYEKTRSELLEMGYDYDLVMALPASTGVAESLSNEGQARRRKEGGVTMAQTVNGLDRTRELVMIYDHYIRADFNNDGFAELRHVRTAGKTTPYILENEEVDRNIYHALTPYLNSFRFFGRSLADNLMDIQRAKSQLWRNAFDNVAYSSIPRKIVKGNVDIGALMTYVQGGIIKCDPNGSIESEVTPFVADTALLMADKVDAIRAERSGFSKETMGLDPAALANATNPVGMSILAQSQLLAKMIATIFAHSGFQTLMEHIRELVLKYEDGEKIFELTGKTMKTDMRRWRKQRSSVVKVGIGYAGKQEELSVMDKLLTLQAQFVLAQGNQINGPLTNAQGIFNTTQRLCRRMGIKDAATYFTDPAKYTPPPQQPTIAEETLKAQVQNMGNQQQIQEARMVADTAKQKSDHDLAVAKMAQDERLAVQKMKHEQELAMTELLYKYGKDARDRHERPATEVKITPTTSPDEAPEDKVAKLVNTVNDKSGKTAKMLGDAAKGLQMAHKKMADTTANLHDTQKEHKAAMEQMASTVTKGIGQLAQAHQQSSQEIIKAVSRKKKIKIMRGPDNKMAQIEEE